MLQLHSSNWLVHAVVMRAFLEEAWRRLRELCWSALPFEQLREEGAAAGRSIAETQF